MAVDGVIVQQKVLLVDGTTSRIVRDNREVVRFKIMLMAWMFFIVQKVLTLTYIFTVLKRLVSSTNG